MSHRTIADGIRFSQKELLDLATAWIVLSVAFALLLSRGPGGQIALGDLPAMVVLCFVTAGVGFLLHELAHKVVAIRFGQVAEFRADYNMLFLAVMSALVGFLFAAPGAVYHRGRVTKRENGLIALAGPVTNLLLAGIFVVLLFAPGIAGRIGQFGLWINLFLAAFNMVPFGPLDGKRVLEWSPVVFAIVFVPSLALAAYVILLVGIGV